MKIAWKPMAINLSEEKYNKRTNYFKFYGIYVTVFASYFS